MAGLPVPTNGDYPTTGSSSLNIRLASIMSESTLCIEDEGSFTVMTAMRYDFLGTSGALGVIHLKAVNPFSF